MKKSKAQDFRKPIIVLFRRDLRLSDHPALAAALEQECPIIPVYILDDETPSHWKLGGASRWWLAQSLRTLDASIRDLGSRLILKSGESLKVLFELISECDASAIYFTRGYEPYQIDFEKHLQESLDKRGVDCRRFGGHILFEPEKVANKSGDPFRVYTSFYNHIAARDFLRSPLPSVREIPAPHQWPHSERLEDWGLEPTKPDWAGGFRETWVAGEHAARDRLALFVDTIFHGYKDQRNVPGRDGTSRLSPHLAFGEISPLQIWHAVSTAADHSGQTNQAEPYLKEIAWREFSYHLLYHFPTLPSHAFKSDFDNFPWGQTDNKLLHIWQKGLTGYPIVDAGMRQLWQTGWMHNRVRMIVASFLIKHMLIPWQKGQDWFWDTLVDADLASNAASWQWVAGSGADASPYFRVFNPVLQGEKFDPKGDYVRTFCPELSKLPNAFVHKPWEAEYDLLVRAGVQLGKTYPRPIVDHAEARGKALAAYNKIKNTRISVV